MNVQTAFKRIAEHHIAHSILTDVTVLLYELDGEVGVVLQHGHPRRESERIPVRIQSSCIYGDTLLAADCDCRAQIDESFRHFLGAGVGVLIYMNQEGRGAGIAAKARSYELHETNGLDTVDAYRTMGLEPDARSYEFAVRVLRDLGALRVELLTNNPRKVEALQDGGLNVVAAQLRVGVTEWSLPYLLTKQSRLGHTLGLPEDTGTGGRGLAPSAFVIGAAVMDHVFSLPRNPKLGKAGQAQSYIRRPGGKGLNQAIAFRRLGGNSSLLTVKGHDHDGDEVANTLAREGVKTRFVGTQRRALSPQTAVLQPDEGAPTYIGWLGEEHRTLRESSIDEWAHEIKASDVVILTLEASVDAIEQTLAHVDESALVVLNASPAVELPYKIDTTTLEDVDVIIGSTDELRALMLGGRMKRGASVIPREEVALELARICGPTVVATEFRSRERTAVAAGPRFNKPICVESPRVRMTDQRTGISPAVGNGDAFCAAFCIEALSRRGARSKRSLSARWWRSGRSPLSNRSVLVDILMDAIPAEAWVTRTRGGGYDTFPRGGQEYEQWKDEHPAIHDEGHD